MGESPDGPDDCGAVMLSYQLDDADWHTLMRQPVLVHARRRAILILVGIPSMMIGLGYLGGIFGGLALPLGILLLTFALVLMVKLRGRKPPAWSSRVNAVATPERIEVSSSSGTINWAWSEVESIDEIGTRCVIVRRKPKAALIVGLDSSAPGDLARLRSWAAGGAEFVSSASLPWTPAADSAHVLIQGSSRPWAMINTRSRRIMIGLLLVETLIFGLATVSEPRSTYLLDMTIVCALLLWVLLVLSAAQLVTFARRGPRQDVWLCEPMQIAVTSMLGPQRVPWQSVKTLRVDRWRVALLLGRGRLLATMPRDAFTPEQLQWVIGCARGAGVRIAGSRSRSWLPGGPPGAKS